MPGPLSFDDRFQLGELLRDDGIRSFLVREKASGQELLAHFLAKGGEAAALLASLDRLPERERQRMVDRGERAGTPYVVTGSLAGYPGFREWLAANAREARPLDSAGAWKVIPVEPSVDEQFLSLFPTGERPQATPAEAPPPAEPKEAGEFTRLFQAPSPGPAEQAKESGEFTRLFQAQPEPSAAPEKSAGPGEFTRFFEPQMRVPPVDVPPLQAIPAASKQGEFTRVFGPGAALGPRAVPSAVPGKVPSLPEASPAPSESVAPETAGATRAFASPQAAPPAGAPPGPGEFTGRFSAAPALTLGQAPEETSAASPASSRHGVRSKAPAISRLPLLLGIAAVGVLLAAVVLFFATRAK